MTTMIGAPEDHPARSIRAGHCPSGGTGTPRDAVAAGAGIVTRARAPMSTGTPTTTGSGISARPGLPRRLPSGMSRRRLAAGRASPPRSTSIRALPRSPLRLKPSRRRPGTHPCGEPGRSHPVRPREAGRARPDQVRPPRRGHSPSRRPRRGLVPGLALPCRHERQIHARQQRERSRVLPGRRRLIARRPAASCPAATGRAGMCRAGICPAGKCRAGICPVAGLPPAMPPVVTLPPETSPTGLGPLGQFRPGT